MSRMLLLDAGNTRVKWALAERGAAPGDWLATGAAARDGIDALGDAWRVAAATVDVALLCNVAGEAMRAALEGQLQRAFGPQAPALQLFRSSPEAGGLRNRYREPSQLGADRFAAAIGARARYPNEALIVATCGTATTIDAVSPQGDFLGGMILPGLDMMARALAAGTAQLPHIDARASGLAPFADNTADAIASGCIAAQAGAIERAATALTEAHGTARCIISGGAGTIIAPHLSLSAVGIGNLVLIGLQVILTEPKR
ncbi:type III pantothenate kinase [Noviherbaspirillum pedocola]|nr:type III pantothenate kinase [Noviherbaspirillum pedocola]